MISAATVQTGVPPGLTSPSLFNRVRASLRDACLAEFRALREYRALKPTLEKVRLLSMVPEPALSGLAQQLQDVLREGIQGDFVECGVWRGGASFLMADLLRRAGVKHRKVWLCDSFEGLPPPEPIDGPLALRYAQSPNSPWYLDNCSASLEEVQASAKALGLAGYVEFVKGWFNESLPIARDRIGPIALLRIDADWHASVRACLDNLYDQVTDGGSIILDDYYIYDGCAVAVHEFLGERRLSHRITSAGGVAIFEKHVPKESAPINGPPRKEQTRATANASSSAKVTL